MTDNTFRATNKAQSYRCQYGHKGRYGGERVCGRRAIYRRKGKFGTTLTYCEKHRHIADHGKVENFQPDPYSALERL